MQHMFTEKEWLSPEANYRWMRKLFIFESNLVELPFLLFSLIHVSLLSKFELKSLTQSATTCLLM